MYRTRTASEVRSLFSRSTRLFVEGCASYPMFCVPSSALYTCNTFSIFTDAAPIPFMPVRVYSSNRIIQNISIQIEAFRSGRMVRENPWPSLQTIPPRPMAFPNLPFNIFDNFLVIDRHGCDLYLESWISNRSSLYEPRSNAEMRATPRYPA